MSVPTGDVQATYAATLVDEWVRAGLRDAVVCPGSRSTPLALALAARPELRLHVRLDERGAGFFALGLSMATGRAAVVCTTSGTAAAELHPAVREAHHGGVPLLVCTADRPPELHGVGAPQTMDQTDLYGGAVRWFFEPGVAREGGGHFWRSLGSRAVAETAEGPAGPGPVHLNLAFVDPLAGAPAPLPPGRPGGAPWHRVLGSRPTGPPSASPPSVGDWPSSAAVVADWPARRGVVVAGAGSGPPGDVLALAGALGWPVLADPRSGCRRAEPGVVAAADAVVRDGAGSPALLPEVVLLLGAPWAARSVDRFVTGAARAGALVVSVDPWWRWRDPGRLVAEVHRAEPAAWLAAARGVLDASGVTGPPGAAPDWRGTWMAAEAAAQQAIDEVLATEASGTGRLSEPALARWLPGALAPGGRLVVASSMPVRDLESFAPALPDPPAVLANRGLNGIDGTVGTTLGVAASGGGPVVGLLGDLAFLHDISSLVRPGGDPPGVPCTLVVVDNDGGGIFSFLPQARSVGAGRFEALFGTPQRAEVAAVAAGLGADVHEVATDAELDEVLATGGDGLRVVRAVVPGRPENVALHERLQEATGRAVAGALAGG